MPFTGSQLQQLRFEKAMGKLNGKRLTYHALTTSYLNLLLPTGGELPEKVDGLPGM